MRLVSFILGLLTLVALIGCKPNHAVGTWQQDVKGGGQLLITIRKDKSFSLLYSTAGEYMVVARIDGTYDSAGVDRWQLHPSATNFVSGNERAAAAAYGVLQDFQNFAASGIFELLGPDVGQMPWGKETTNMRRIQGSDIAPKMTQEESDFARKAQSNHELLVAQLERFKTEQAQHTADQNAIYAQRQQEIQQQQQALEQQLLQQQQQSQTQPQPDPSATQPSDDGNSAQPSATPDPIAPGSVSSGDSTPPVNKDAGNDSTNGDSSGASDQSTSSTTGSGSQSSSGI